MTTTSKFALSAIVAGALTLGQVAQAGLISGSVSFAGSVQGYTSTTGTGQLASDLSTAHSLTFSGGDLVASSPAPNGSFALALGGSVNIYSPLVISPVQLPVPQTTPLWVITQGGHTWTFVVSSMSEPVDTANYLVLTGTGTISDNLGDTSNTGTWTATFTTGNGGSGVTFAYNASASANPGVPETGTSVMLLGLGLVAIGAYSQFRKQVA